MNKQLLFIVAFISSAAFSYGQVWEDVYGGTSIGSTDVVYCDGVDNLLYVGGDFDTVGPNYYSSRGFATWDGSAWNDLSGAFGGDFTNTIARYNGEIYHALEQGSAFHGIQTLESRIANFNESIKVLFVFHGDLYAGGTFTKFDTSSTPFNGIARYNGTKWSKVGPGLKGDFDSGAGVYSMCIYDGDLYVAGIFDSAGPVPCKNIARWNGSHWFALDEGLNQTITDSAKGSALTVYNNELVVGGLFNKAGNVPVSNLARWNGSIWSSLDATFNQQVCAAFVYNDHLYVGGFFGFDGNNKNHIAKYDGSSWSSLGGGITKGVLVNSLCEWNGKLIVGGKFDELEGTIEVSNLASWTESSPGHQYLPLTEDDYVVTPSIISGPSVIYLEGSSSLRKAEVTDERGNLILTRVFSESDIYRTIDLDAGKLKHGVHFIRLETVSGIIVKKILVL